MLIRLASKCSKCKDSAEDLQLWNIAGGICDKCLIKKFIDGLGLKKMKKKYCSCLHKDLEALYAKSRKK